MPTITFDGPNKLITIGYDGPITEVTAEYIYSRWKDWVAQGNAQYQEAFGESVGGNELGGGTSIAGYYFVRNDLGWRITHTQNNYEIRVSGDIYPADPNTVFIVPTAQPYSVQFVFQRSAASYVTVGEPSAVSGAYGASQWKYQTGSGQPSAGYLRYSAPTLTISDIDTFGFTQDAALDRVATGDTITVRDTNGALWYLDVTATPTDNGTWWSIPAIAVSGPEPPKNNQKVLVSFVAPAAGGTGPTPEDIATAVWNEPMSTHNATGSFGKRVKELLPTLWGIK